MPDFQELIDAGENAAMALIDAGAPDHIPGGIRQVCLDMAELAAALVDGPHSEVVEFQTNRLQNTLRIFFDDLDQARREP